MKNVICFRLALAGLLIAGLAGQYLHALLHAQETTKKLVWKHGLSFNVRKGDVTKFDEKDNPKFGTEIFLDKDIDKAVYIAETGAIAVGIADKFKAKEELDPPKSFHGLKLRVRPVN